MSLSNSRKAINNLLVLQRLIYKPKTYKHAVLFEIPPNQTSVYHITDQGKRITDRPMEIRDIRARYGSLLTLEKKGFRLIKAGFIALMMTMITNCGKGSDAGTSVSSITNPAPGVVNINLTSILTQPGNTAINGTAMCVTDYLLHVPKHMQTFQNANEHGRATLHFGNIQLYYQWESVGVYTYYDCSGCNGLDIVVSKNSVVYLEIQTGYTTQTTQLNVVVEGNN